jgi:hypothetical protein
MGIDRVIAIHEAGHAVARILVAEEFGIPPAEMIVYIEVGSEQGIGSAFYRFGSQAVTVGPTLSSDIQAIFDRQVRGLPPGSWTQQHEDSAVAGAGRADVQKWLRAKMLTTVFASAAEAKLTRRPVLEVFTSPESIADYDEAMHDGVRSGLTSLESLAILDEALTRAVLLVNDNRVWQAIVALADVLPISGRMSGRGAALVIMEALDGFTLEPRPKTMTPVD